MNKNEFCMFINIIIKYSMEICYRGYCMMCSISQKGIDELLAEHIAHLFIRDPISLFAEKLDLNDEEEVDHFEVSVSLVLI